MLKDQEIEVEGEEGLYEHHRFLAPAGLTPLRVDKYIQTKLEGISRNKIQNGIRAGAVLVDGETIKPNHKLKPGETITILLPKPVAIGESIVPENIPLDIRYEDDDVMVIYKPPGLVVHPGIGQCACLASSADRHASTSG